MLESISVQLRNHRRKTLFIAVALLLGALYHSFKLPDQGYLIFVDYVRNDDLDIVILRTFGGFFSMLAVVGYVSQINRDLFPERYKKDHGDCIAELSKKAPD